MDNRPNQDALFTEFRQECSIRRTTNILDIKRKRIREDIQQLIKHLGLIVPPITASESINNQPNELLIEALGRLGDDAFAQLVLQVMQDL